MAEIQVISNVFGWAGMLLLLASYFLVSCRRIKPESRSYQLMNLFGALGLLFNTYVNRAWPAAFLQFAWALISVYSLIRINLNKKRKKQIKNKD